MARGRTAPRTIGAMTDRARQQAIIRETQVVQDFDAAGETERRVQFLVDYLRHTGARGYVLGISGGVDSTVAGRLAQLAVERVRAAGGTATFVGVRLPYQVQRDEDDARDAVAFIAADETTTVNIGPGTDALWSSLMNSDSVPDEATLTEFVRGNVKARLRMTAQYAVAGARGMLVIGTDQAAENLVGFFTKYGDGGADLLPLAGLTKRMIREIGGHLGAPSHLVVKVPTADLESDRPLLPDEVALGVSYQDVDAYLEGGEIPAEAEAAILSWHARTAHKRALPVTPQDFEASAGH